MATKTWIEWVEPFGPHSEPVYMRVERGTAIAAQKEIAHINKGFQYETDEQALQDFVVCNWAKIRIEEVK